MSPEYLKLLRAAARDVRRMADYESHVAERRLRAARVGAWNAFERTKAFERAMRKQTAADLRLFLEFEVSRPCPPLDFEADQTLWEIVRSELAQQLDAMR